MTTPEVRERTDRIDLATRLMVKRDSLLPIPLYLILAILVLAPLGYLLFAVFQTGSPNDPTAEFTWSNITALWEDAVYLQVLGNTLWLALLVTIFSLVIGVGLAWLIARTDIPGRKWFELLVPLPLFLSPFAGALAWLILGSERAGLLNAGFKAIFGSESGFMNSLTFPGLVFIMVLFHIPYAYLFTVAPLKNMDGALEEASRISGASVPATMLRVTFPIVLPGMLSAALMVFVLSAEMFSIPALIGTAANYQTLPAFIYTQTKFSPPDWGAATAAGLLLLVVMIVGVVLHARATRMANRFVTVTGKGVKPATLHLGRWRWVSVIAPLAYLTLAVFLPMGTLLFVSFLRYVTPNITLDLFTLHHWELLTSNPVFVTGFQNTVLISVIGSIIATVFAFLLVYSWRRLRSPFRRTTEVIAMLPIAIPGIVLGVGVLWAVVQTPLYGTIWLLVFAYMARYLANPVRIFSSTMVQIDPALEEASRVAGAGMVRTMARVAGPLLMPAALSGWLILLIMFTRELNIAIMVYSRDSIVLPVIMWGAIETGSLSFASIIALFESAIILLAFAVARRVFKIDLSSSRT